MKTINGIFNVITYIGSIFVVMSATVVGSICVKITLSRIPLYFPDVKNIRIIEIVLWCGLMFALAIFQNVMFEVWKKHIKLNNK